MTFTGPYAKLIISRCLCWLTGFYKGPSVKIESVNTDHYLIPLPNTLTDAMHGEMTGFTVVTRAHGQRSGRAGVHLHRREHGRSVRAPDDRARPGALSLG